MLLYNIPACSCRARLTEGTMSSCHQAPGALWTPGSPVPCWWSISCIKLMVSPSLRGQVKLPCESLQLGKTPACVCGTREGLKEEPDSLIMNATPLEATSMEGKVFPGYTAQSRGQQWPQASPETALSPLVPAPAQLEEQSQTRAGHSHIQPCVWFPAATAMLEGGQWRNRTSPGGQV